MSSLADLFFYLFATACAYVHACAPRSMRTGTTDCSTGRTYGLSVLELLNLVREIFWLLFSRGLLASGQFHSLEYGLTAHGSRLTVLRAENGPKYVHSISPSRTAGVTSRLLCQFGDWRCGPVGFRIRVEHNVLDRPQIFSYITFNFFIFT